jgi:hypothetical protein
MDETQDWHGLFANSIGSNACIGAIRSALKNRSIPRKGDKNAIFFRFVTGVYQQKGITEDRPSVVNNLE